MGVSAQSTKIQAVLMNFYLHTPLQSNKTTNHQRMERECEFQLKVLN